MSQAQFEGMVGKQRLKALIAAVWTVRKGMDGTQEYLLGWVGGLVDGNAIDDDIAFTARRFILDGGSDVAVQDPVPLYLYPNATYQRVEGKSMLGLEEEIMAGGPHAESRVSRIYALSADESHPLHYVAKHYMYLSRAKLASVK